MRERRRAMTDNRSSDHEIEQALSAEQGRSGLSGRPNILRLLLAIQDRIGYVPPQSVPQIARGIGASEAEVAGVLSYYPDLRTAAPGRHVIRICTGESCVANHCVQLVKALRDRLGIEIGQTDPGGRFTLERVYCMGNCAVSPAVAVNQDLYGRVEPTQIPSLLDRYQ
ncbi:MAG: formate dehydrogenase subunit gamma [Nitrospira sp.]